jgi:hypothetical protein
MLAGDCDDGSGDAKRLRNEKKKQIKEKEKG